MIRALVLAWKVYSLCHRHIALAKSILGYLERTRNLSLLFPSRSRTQRETFSAANWAACQETRKYTTGILLTVKDGPILWTKKKQIIIYLSSEEAEYITLLSFILESGKSGYGKCSNNSVLILFLKMKLMKYNHFLFLESALRKLTLWIRPGLLGRIIESHWTSTMLQKSKSTGFWVPHRYKVNVYQQILWPSSFAKGNYTSFPCFTDIFL